MWIDLDVINPRFPEIPNFTILSRIGGGAYGEVYLARSVTGLFRAVKVVSRENFELEKTFEREFQGIQRYERVSQGHSGLVDVLHVGREDDFYYYVMELADHETGESIDSVEPTEYQPKTLTSALKINPTIEIGECVTLGRAIADALGHLHRAGLTHRDVKPSNIIYNNGEPQLADIGLVAASGQRTYVGTEGYVPPEGPGTSSADLYALAMVLYEMQTGNDRLDFPELPTNHQLSPTVNRDQWRALNAVICRAGSPDPRKRYETGQNLSEALRKVTGNPVAKSKFLPTDSQQSGSLLKKLAFALSLLLATALAVYIAIPRNNKDRIIEIPSLGGTETDPKEEPDDTSKAPPDTTSPAFKKDPIIAIPVATRRIKLDSEPPGASVWVNGKPIGPTPLPIKDYQLGKLDLVFKHEGYFDKTETLEVTKGSQPLTHVSQLQQDFRPKNGEPWVNITGMTFTVRDDDSKYISGVTRYAYQSYLKSTDSSGTIFDPNNVVQVRSADRRWSFCDWLTKKDRENGYLSDQQYHMPVGPADGSNTPEMYCLIEDQQGTLIIDSATKDVDIYDLSVGEIYLGKTPLTLQRRIGSYQLEARCAGHASQPIRGYLNQEAVSIPIQLVKDDSIVFGKSWVNSLGMPMVPVGDIMVATYETRKQDYNVFLQAGGFNTGVFPPTFPQTESHPLVLVNRDDAMVFCKWLTNHERNNRRISRNHEYRLPTDLEWSQIAGMTESSGATPILRENQFQNIYPWGRHWPPPERAGNFADSSAKQLGNYVLSNYTDQFAYTAPVGKFKSNKFGIHDLAGNVWEWVSDSYGDGTLRGVVRGGGWESYQSGILFTSYRNAIKPTSRSDKYGFRCVLVDNQQPRPNE